MKQLQKFKSYAIRRQEWFSYSFHKYHVYL